MEKGTFPDVDLTEKSDRVRTGQSRMARLVDGWFLGKSRSSVLEILDVGLSISPNEPAL